MSKPDLILPDLHSPHHDPMALAVVRKVARRIKPRRVIVLGDWLDCEAFSTHGKSSIRERDEPLEEELQIVKDALADFRKSGARIIYIEGNHEQRIERLALKLGGQLGRDVYHRISPAVLLDDYVDEWIPYSEPLAHYEVTPDLWAVHGWSHAKHAAAKHLEKAVSVSVVFGHTHRAQSFTKREPSTGRILKAWSPGCLSKLAPIYTHKTGPTEWAHGFSLVYQSRRDPLDWSDYTIQIKPGGFCVLPDGKQVRL